jgi:hypothetical protein
MKRRDLLLGGAAAALAPVATAAAKEPQKMLDYAANSPEPVGLIRKPGGTLWAKNSLAKMLHIALKERGVLFCQMDRRFSKEGAKMGVRSEYGTNFMQRSVSQVAYEFGPVQVDLMADNITVALTQDRHNPFSPKRLAVVFAELLVPSGGVMEADMHYFGEVAVRTLQAYVSQTDEIVSRMDVIFASAPGRNWTIVDGPA